MICIVFDCCVIDKHRLCFFIDIVTLPTLDFYRCVQVNLPSSYVNQTKFAQGQLRVQAPKVASQHSVAKEEQGQDTY